MAEEGEASCGKSMLLFWPWASVRNSNVKPVKASEKAQLEIIWYLGEQTCSGQLSPTASALLFSSMQHCYRQGGGHLLPVGDLFALSLPASTGHWLPR